MNIFLTGGTGFIGSHFINLAFERNHNIFCLKRPYSYPKAPLVKDPKWIIGELDKIKIKDLKGIDVLVHFASSGVSPQKASWEELYHWNVLSLLRILKIASKTNIKKVVIAGSFIEYGLTANDYDYIPAHASLRPTSPYASSKAAGFEMAHGFCINNSIPLVYKRIFSAYGDYQFKENFWPSLKFAAVNGKDFPMTKGDQIRDFICVNNVVLNFMKSVEDSTTKLTLPIVENVCSGNGQTVLDFANYWWSHWNAKGKLKPGIIAERKREPKRFVGKI